MGGLTAGAVRRMLTNSHVDHKRLTVTTFGDHVKISGPIEARRHTWDALFQKGLVNVPTADNDEWSWR